MMNRTIAAYLVSFALLQCGVRCTMQNNLAGGGTDVSNPVVTGRAVGFCGSSASDTKVMLIPVDYNAYADAGLPSSSIDTTDTSGLYLVIAPSPGVYNIEAEQLPTGNKHFVPVDTLKMNDTLVVPLDMIWQPGSIRILFPDATYADSGYVYIPGSTMFAFILNGVAVLDSVPAGIIPEIRYVNLLNEDKNHLVNAEVSVSSGNVTTVADYYSWRHSRQIVLNTTASGAGVSGDVYHFPVLVRLNGANFDFTQAQRYGHDVRFAKPNHEPLEYDIDTWDSANGTAAVWIKLDTVYGNNSSQYILMCWGNRNAADQSNGSVVFDTGDGYRAVWHLGEASGNAAGEVTYSNVVGTYYGSLPRRNAGGAVGGSQTLNGYGDFIGMGSGALNPGLSTISLSAWIKRGDTGVRTTTLMAKSNGDSPSVNYGYVFAIDWENYVHFYLSSGGQSWGDTGSVDLKSAVRLVDMSSWHHLFIVIDRSGNGNCRIYMDGDDRTGTVKGDILHVGAIANTLPLRIGIEADASYPYKGSIDEMVMAYTVRSSDWVKLCYMNQKAVDALVEFK
jgi:hypothetical protein